VFVHSIKNYYYSQEFYVVLVITSSKLLSKVKFGRFLKEL